MNTVKSTIDSATSSIKSGTASVRGDIDEMVGTEKFNQAYKLAGEAASDMVDSVKNKATSAYYDRKEQAGELADKAESYVKDKPLIAIGVAFVTGWAISKIFSK